MKNPHSGKASRKKTNSSETPAMNYSFEKVKPLNYIQGEYLQAMHNNSIIFGIGSAGTGKTFLAANYAADLLFHKKIEKIIITRPNVEVTRSLGFLPGELDEKFAPYLEPFNDCFTKFLGKGFYSYCLNKKDIEPIPLGFMRGRSFDNSLILIDEAQNMNSSEFKMLLSRIGRNCKMIISGDPRQTDIKDSGLLNAISRLSNIKGITAVEFLDEDIVRSPLCKQIILAYNKI